MMIGETAHRIQMRQILHKEQQMHAIRQVEAALLTTVDLPGILNVLATGLPQLSILLRNAAQILTESRPSGASPRIRVSIRQTLEAVTITIVDNGTGIAEDVRKRVFEPFFTTKPVGKGIGLGLSVAYFIIVTHHQGQLSVTSAPGEGTAFTIRFPLRRRAP